MPLTRTCKVDAADAQPGDILEIDAGCIGPTQLEVVRVGKKAVTLRHILGQGAVKMSCIEFAAWADGRYPD